MIGAVRSEALRLRRVSFGLGLGLMVLFAAVGTVVGFTTATDAAVDGPQPGGGAVTTADLAAADGFAAGLHVVSSLVGIVALSFWAVAAAGDYRSGLIRLLVQAVPRRWPLVVGKAVALLGWTLLGTLAATVVASALGPVLADGAGVDTAAWSDGPVGSFLTSWVDLTVSTTVWGAIGLALATLTRSLAVAIGGGIAYLLVVENLILITADTDLPYLPGQALVAIAGGGTDDVSFATGLVLAAGLVSAAVAVSALQLVRRDIVE